MTTDDWQRQRFAEVVLPHLGDALTLARWLTGSRADGEDVVQDASLRAFGAIGSFRDGSPRAWVLTIVRNTAFSWLRKNRPKIELVTSDDSVFEQAAPGLFDNGAAASPEAALIAKADAAMVQDAIAALPIAYREIIVLREIEDLSYREISAVTSLPIGTVMSRLSRARKSLALRLGAPLPNDIGAP